MIVVFVLLGFGDVKWAIQLLTEVEDDTFAFCEGTNGHVGELDEG